MNFKEHGIIMFLVIAMVSRREFFVRQRSSADYAALDAYALVEVLIVVISFLVIISKPLLTRTTLTSLKTSQLPLIAFFGLALVCAPLSQNPAYSVFFCGEYLSQIILIFCIIASSKTHEMAVKRVFVLCSVATILTVGFKVVLYGFGGGLFDYKSNTGGACAAMLSVFSLVYFVGETYSREMRKFAIGGVLVGFLALLMTTSAASIVSTVFGVALAGFISGRKRGPFIVLIILGIGVGVAFPEKAFSVLFPGKNLHDVNSFHGRTHFWEDALRLVEKKPFLGYGYAMGANVGRLRGTNLHNSVISLLVGNGIVGLALFGFAFLRCFRESMRLIKISEPGAVAAISALAAGLVNSNSISFFGEEWRGPSFLMFSFWAMIAVFMYRARLNKSVSY